MRNIRNYTPDKYTSNQYTELQKGIYRCAQGFVTSLCFEQEPELGEGTLSNDISQYPLEDVLDQFCVYISDFYRDLNSNASKDCCLEFCSNNEKNIISLYSIIGKHVYNKTIIDNGTELVKLIIE